MSEKEKAAVHIVFIGAGHGHLPVLKHGAAFRAAGHRLTLISPDDFYYSGLVTGVLAGDYAPSEDRVDIAAFAEKHGVELVRARVDGLDLAGKAVLLSGGSKVSFDLLSIAVGSEARSLEGAAVDNVTPVKPITSLIKLNTRLKDKERLAVIGGGLAGCEIALCLKSAHPELEVSLFTRSGIMKGWEKAAMKVRHAFEKAGISLHENCEITRVSDSALIAKGGETYGFDEAVLATGLECPPFLCESGLAVDGMGAVRVNTHLQSVSHPDVFAIGDCMAFEPRKLDKAGVYAIRGAPILEHNLLARAAGKKLKAFKPQERYLWIMNLGGGKALAARPPFTWQGRLAWLLKDYIDARFVKGFK